MYTSLFHSPTTSMLATARFSTKIKTGFQHFLLGQSKVSVSIQTLVETVHTTGWFEMFYNEVYWANAVLCEVYPTCVPFKLCEFNLIIIITIEVCLACC